MDAKTLSDIFSVVFGVLISFIFKVVPSLDNWYQNKLNPNYRGLVMLGFSILVPIGVYGASCFQIFNTVACTTTVIPDMIRAWVLFVAANQGIFLMTAPSKATKLRKDEEAGLLTGTGRTALENQHPRGDQE